MLGVGYLVVKGWQLYGPPTEQVKSTAMNAWHMAQKAWNNWQAPNQDATPNADAKSVAPVFGQAQSQQAAPNGATLAPMALSPAAPATSTPADFNKSPTGLSADQALSAPLLTGDGTAAAPAKPLSQSVPSVADRKADLPAMFARLEKLGVTQRQLTPWGSSGQLYRFCCNAPLGDSPAMTRHFESVAADGNAAVEQVLTQVEAWRTAQRDGNNLLR